MKTDNVTKIILTVIAVNLSLLTVKNFDIIPSAYAKDSITHNGILPSVQYGLIPLNEDGSLTVKLTSNNELDVNIVGVNTSDELDINIAGVDTSDELDINIAGVETSDELDINIDEVGGGYVSNGGPIPVEVE